jgi:hypothetical protein
MAESDPSKRSAGLARRSTRPYSTTLETAPGSVAALTWPVAHWRPGSARASLFLAAQAREQRARPQPLAGTRRVLDGVEDQAPDRPECELSLRALDAAGLCAPTSPTLLVKAAERALLELGAHLSQLVGSEGYRALLARALQVAATDYPFLASVEPAANPPGRLVGLPRRAQRRPPREVHLALAVTLTNLIRVLSTFIGDDLTLRLLSDVWPRLAACSPRTSRAQVESTGT